MKIDGADWGHRRVAAATYETVFGGIGSRSRLSERPYQRAGRGRVAVPLELRLGIVEGAYTPRVARILTKAVALMPEAEAENLVQEVGGRAAEQVDAAPRTARIASRYEGRREILENAIRARDAIPVDTVTIQVALDGVMVPQDGEHARGARPKDGRSGPTPARTALRAGRSRCAVGDRWDVGEGMA